MDLYIQTWKKFADFEGRARRKEFWLWMLLNCIIMGVLFYVSYLFFIDKELFLTNDPKIVSGAYDQMKRAFSGVAIYHLIAFIPSLAVTVRRLHDVGKSGAWYFIACIPVIGWIWILVLLLTDSQEGDNEYGPNPKQVVLDF